MAANRFRSQFAEIDQAQNFLEQARGKNMMIEEVLDRIRNQNPDLDIILNRVIGW
ncbi:MAG: hypothetical protein ACK55Z_00880 [bacterium]